MNAPSIDGLNKIFYNQKREEKVDEEINRGYQDGQIIVGNSLLYAFS